MNMAFSGVAGSRPARGCHLADGDAKSTVKGAEQAFQHPSLPGSTRQSIVFEDGYAGLRRAEGVCPQAGQARV
jgi:hypothetical protein